MRALVIDDSRAMRRIVSGILEGLGYEVQQAGHGREGLDVLDGGWRARPGLRRLEHAGDGRTAVRLRRPRQPGLAAA